VWVQVGLFSPSCFGEPCLPDEPVQGRGVSTVVCWGLLELQLVAQAKTGKSELRSQLWTLPKQNLVSWEPAYPLVFHTAAACLSGALHADLKVGPRGNLHLWLGVRHSALFLTFL